MVLGGFGDFWVDLRVPGWIWGFLVGFEDSLLDLEVSAGSYPWFWVDLEVPVGPDPLFWLNLELLGWI